MVEQIQVMGLCLHWMLSGGKNNSEVVFIFLIKAVIGKEEAVADNSEDGGHMGIL